MVKSPGRLQKCSKKTLPEISFDDKMGRELFKRFFIPAGDDPIRTVNHWTLSDHFNYTHEDEPAPEGRHIGCPGR
jgi:hypothetical protein